MSPTPSPTPNPLEQYERTYCDCRKCTAACKTMPGSLAPGDFEEIAAYCGALPSAIFLEQNFQASDGPVVAIKNPNGTFETCQIPTIVPKQDFNGACIFLDEDEHCMIHPVAPFGCRTFNVCDPPSMEDDAKSAAMLNLILNKPVYLKAWKHLVERGHFAKPLMERREDLLAALKREE